MYNKQDDSVLLRLRVFESGGDLLDRSFSFICTSGPSLYRRPFIYRAQSTTTNEYDFINDRMFFLILRIISNMIDEWYTLCVSSQAPAIIAGRSRNNKNYFYLNVERISSCVNNYKKFDIKLITEGWENNSKKFDISLSLKSERNSNTYSRLEFILICGNIKLKFFIGCTRDYNVQNVFLRC